MNQPVRHLSEFSWCVSHGKAPSVELCLTVYITSVCKSVPDMLQYCLKLPILSCRQPGSHDKCVLARPEELEASAAAALLGINTAPTSADPPPDARQQPADGADNFRLFTVAQIWTCKILTCKILTGMYPRMVPHPVAVLLL